MRNEEIGMKEYWEFQDCHKSEKETIRKSIDACIIKTYALIETEQFKAVTTRTCDEVVEKKKKMNAEAMKSYKGPSAAAPKKLTRKDILTIRADLELDLKQKALSKALKQSEKDVKAQLVEKRAQFFNTYVGDTMLQGFVGEFILTVCEEAIVEGRLAKQAAEKVSGLIFPDPAWMQV